MIIDQFPGAQLGQEPQMLQKIRTGDIDFMFSCVGQRGNHLAAVGRAVDPLPVPLRGAPGAGGRHAGAGGRDTGDVRRHGEGRALPDAADARPAQSVWQEGDPRHRRRQEREDPGAGDADRGHDVPRLRRADRAHAVRLGLHQPADRRGGHGRERHQRLRQQQALRGRADHVADRARGEQQPAVGQRQGLEQRCRRSSRAGSPRRPTRSPRRSRRWRSSWNTSRAPSWRRWA